MHTCSCVRGGKRVQGGLQARQNQLSHCEVQNGVYKSSGKCFARFLHCVEVYHDLYHTSMKYCNLIGLLQVVYFTYTPVKCESFTCILLNLSMITINNYNAKRLVQGTIKKK